MITKYYCIWFAKKPCCTAYTDLERAVRYCRGNLLSRYGVDIDLESRTDSLGHYFVKLSIPDEVASNFNAGRHLRGISVYLLKHHKDRYEPFKVCTRLLNYEYAGTGQEPLDYRSDIYG